MTTRFSQRQIDKLSASNLDILEALATFRFLTTSQFITLGIGSSQNSVYNMMRRFEAFPKPLIHKSSFSEINSDKPGRTYKEQLVTLTRHGAELLRFLDPDETDFSEATRQRVVADRDYLHTKETVDFHILVDQFCALYGCSLDCFHSYHDLGKAAPETPRLELERQTPRFEFAITDKFDHLVAEHRFTADATFHLTDPIGKGHLFALEVQRGMDTKRLHTKLREHYIPALGEGAISNAYGVDYDPTILILCENPSLMKHTLERLREDPLFKDFEEYFAFHTVSELQLTPPPSGKVKRITKATRAEIAAQLQGREDWQMIMDQNALYCTHPRRLAEGWRFIGGKVGTIF